MPQQPSVFITTGSTVADIEKRLSICLRPNGFSFSVVTADNTLLTLADVPSAGGMSPILRFQNRRFCGQVIKKKEKKKRVSKKSVSLSVRRARLNRRTDGKKKNFRTFWTTVSWITSRRRLPGCSRTPSNGSTTRTAFASATRPCRKAGCGEGSDIWTAWSSATPRASWRRIRSATSGTPPSI